MRHQASGWTCNLVRSMPTAYAQDTIKVELNIMHRRSETLMICSWYSGCSYIQVYTGEASIKACMGHLTSTLQHVHERAFCVATEPGTSRGGY
jgi:hypothetical protein